jgi:hypothetical protein
MNPLINDALVAWLRLPVAEQERAATILLSAIETKPAAEINLAVIAF